MGPLQKACKRLILEGNYPPEASLDIVSAWKILLKLLQALQHDCKRVATATCGLRYSGTQRERMKKRRKASELRKRHLPSNLGATRRSHPVLLPPFRFISKRVLNRLVRWIIVCGCETWKALKNDR